MPSTSISSAILSTFEEQDPEAELTVREIVDGVRDRLTDRDRLPKDNEVRGRLSTLHKEGVLNRPERGHYALVQADPETTNELRQLAEIVSEHIRPGALRRTVLWDATPYLRLAEDGGPGTRLVVEHEVSASLRDEVEVAWPGENTITTWNVNTSGPLGVRLWEPERGAPYRIPEGIVFVDRQTFGATGLTPAGYRTPFPERILVEFLGENGPPEAAPIVRTLLQDQSLHFDRLWAAAETHGVTAEVGALLAGVGADLRPQLRADFLARLPSVVGTLIEGER